MLDKQRTNIILFMYIIGGLYIVRLFYLQIIDSKYRSLGALNSIKREVNIPLRGQIYDRNNRLIVSNEEVYDMYVVPNKVDTASMNKDAFCSLFKITRVFFDSTYKVAWEYNKVKPSLFLRQLSKDDYASVIDAMIHYPGFMFEQSFYRKYPGHTMANALGYIGEIPKKMFENQETEYYRKGDYIGLSGIEKYYENELRGTRGVKFTLQNVHGEVKGQYNSGKFDTVAVIGSNLYTSIDLPTQQLADTLFQGKTGAVVAIDPSTGGIIAMGSYPTYDPVLLSGKQFSKNYSKLAVNPDRPLNNRPISAFYRPGSTFKLVQGSIGLHMGVIDPKTSFSGTPSMFVFHSGPGEAANLYTAIKLSSNPYFYNVFRKIIGNNSETSPFQNARKGLKTWEEIVSRFGFGKKLGIDLPSETKGLLPNVERYDKVYGKEQWKFSNIYSVSIGEGELGVNVLKLANLSATLANRGHWFTPNMIKAIGTPKTKNKVIEIQKNDTGIDPRHFEHIVEGMNLVVKEGTGRAAIIEGIEVCGKTGTSQNAKGKDHAIFIAFAPRVNPKIAIAVVVENAGYGGTASAPIAGLMMEQYLKGKTSRQAYKNEIAKRSYTTVAAAGGPKSTTSEAEELKKLEKSGSKPVPTTPAKPPIKR
ncbi:MAG: penicillin-binding transpeptidase domain-containing protein [Leadbetterella sp.]